MNTYIPDWRAWPLWQRVLLILLTIVLMPELLAYIVLVEIIAVIPGLRRLVGRRLPAPWRPKL